MNIARLSILVLAVSLMAANGGSQAVATSRWQQGGQESKAVSQHVTLQLSGVTVQTAVATLAEKTGLKVLINDEVSAVTQRVTVKISNMSVEKALATITRGTQVVARVAPDGETIVLNLARSLRVAQGVIMGKVMDSKTGQGIARASVSVGADRGVATDENGAYRLTGVSTGVHVLTVRLVGYARQTRQITVSEGITVTADFKLEPSISALDQVVVTGTVVTTELKAVPSAITVVTAKQIEERGITRIDQLFRGDIPGLFSLNLGSSALLDEVTMFSRGATAIVDRNGKSGSAGTTRGTNPIKTYVDGVELADSKYLSQIDPSSIERIEILTGPQASTIYGANAINGVMQIFTKRGYTAKPNFTVAVTSGVVQNSSSSHLAPEHITEAGISGTEGRWSYNVGGSWNYMGSWTPSKQTQRLSMNGGGHMDLGKLTADLSVRQGLTRNRQRGTATQGDVDRLVTGIFAPTSSAGLLSPQTQSLIGHTFGVSLRYRPYSWWSHEVGIGSDVDNTETIATSPVYSSPFDTSLYINSSTTVRASQRYNTTMQVPLGSLASVTSLNLTIGGDHWRTNGSSWQAQPLSLTGNITPINNLTRAHPSKNSGVYAQGQLGIRDALFFYLWS